MVSTLLLLALSTTLPSNASRPRPVPNPLIVDCSAGQNLALALRAAENHPGARIQFRGTCVGPFTITTDGLVLEGASVSESVLAGPTPAGSATVLSIEGARNVIVRRATVKDGAIGIRFEDSPGGSVVDSELMNNGSAIFVHRSPETYVGNCSLHDNDVGVDAYRNASVSVQGSTFARNRNRALSALLYSTLGLSDCVVEDSGIAGATADIYSEIWVYETRFERNGQVQVSARDHGRIECGSGCTLGASGDATRYAAGVRDATLAGYSGSVFAGDISAMGNSQVEFASATISGSVSASLFARVVMYGTAISGIVACDSGADLVCSGAQTVGSWHCPTAAGCTAPPALTVGPELPPPIVVPKPLH